ncbi:hypothetical protein [uncultured Dysgonomonas sp.]|uniref:Peptidase S74 domain-containing protein n=1 Tax=uncultured Dysgonomonas sp. TaxID=206096 RepID=A0A212IY74_9BACT|nr:hypothetical protein [uncultured Dysgonomonas sp.]SBV91895.1 conserved hypothetical protein [uncultured Dysgonomonas sp.]
MITLYSKDDLTTKAEIKKFTYNGQFLGECFVSATITSPSPINFEIGDYCIFRGERFELNYIPAKEKQASANSYGDAFVYDNIKFNSLADELTRVDFIDIVLPDNNIHYTSKPDFSFYAGSVKDLADRIQANLNAEFTGDKAWNVVVLPELVTPDRNITVSGLSVWEALALVSSEFAANFIIRNRTITIGTSGYAVGAVFGYGKGNGLYDIQQNTNQDAKIITRLRAYGSTRNLPNRYYNKLKDESDQPYISESAYIPNLMLPDFPVVQNDPKRVYLESDNIAEYGVRYGHVYFDGSDDNTEIYPSLEGMTSEQLADAGIIVSLPSGDNGNIDEVLGANNPTDNGEIPENPESIDGQFTIYLKDLGFDLSEKDSSGNYVYATTDTMQINMRSGMCVGRTFDVLEDGITKDTSLGYTRFKVICNRFTDDSVDMAYPNSQYHIDSGDKFVLLGISMPDVYIKAASQRLLSAAWEYLSQNDETKYTYTPKIDEIFMARHPEIGDAIKEGDIFNFTDTDLDIDASVIIQNLKITYDLSSKPVPTYEISLSNERISTTIQKMQNAISSLQQNVTGVSIDQVKSLIASIGTRYYLSKLYDDTANGNMNFMQNVSIVKDLLVNEDIISKGNVFSDQFGNETFTSGQFGSGFRAWLAANGQSYAEFDNLMVRREMIVNTLTIAEIKSVGGQILLSLASMYCNGVTDGGAYWKCTFDTADGTISNQFAVDDQVICRKFNGANIKYYWARVTSVGTDYINISKTDKDGSGIPAINDEIIQFGNRTNTSRQSAIMLSAYGSDAPSIKQYAGINSYNLTGKEVTVISPSGNKFTGDFVIQSSGTNVTTAIDNAKNTAISTAATDATNKVNSIQIGGRNLILNSNFKSGVASSWGLYQASSSLDIDTTFGNVAKVLKTPGTSIGGIHTYPVNARTSGNNFIATVWIKADTASRIRVAQEGLSQIGTDFDVTTEWQKYAISGVRRSGVYNSFYIRSYTDSYFYIANVKYEEGNKATDWSPAPEDVQANIDAAQTAATNASTAASNAQTSANTANSLLADIANDNLLIPSEKQDVLKEWQIIQGEYPTVVAQATTYSVSSSDYTAKYNALSSYITPLLSSMTTNSTIVATTFRSTFKDYYDSKIVLLKLVTDKAKTIADQAQTDANNANNNAQLAQQAADAAKTVADQAKLDAKTADDKAVAANSLLSDIASDNKLVASEKQDTQKEWDAIKSEYTKNVSQATSFGVSFSVYQSAYNALNTYITPLLSDLNTTSDIMGTTFRNTFKSYYDARTDLLNAISGKAKSLADQAQIDANTAISNANAAQTAANNAQTTADLASASASTANSLISDISSDNKFTPNEKSQARQEWNVIATELSVNNTQADTFGITTEKTAYNSAFQALANYLNNGTAWSTGVPSWIADANLSVTTTINGSTFRANWKAYYDARTALLNAIAKKAKQLADAAQSSADTANAGLLNKVAYSEYNAQMQVLNTQISAKVSQTDFNVLGQRVSDTESSITQQAGQISSVVTKVDNINIGGRNILFNSKAIQSVGGSGSETSEVTAWTTLSAILSAGETYTLSAKSDGIWGSVQGTDTVQMWIMKDKQVVAGQYWGTSDKNFITFTVPVDGNYWIRIDSNKGSVNHNFWEFKLENGNIPTDWSPAPEDVQANIDAANTAAGNAQISANSKNRTHYQDAQPTAPSGGFTIGDIWQKTTLTDINGNVNADSTKNVCRLEYRWNGTTWVQINVNISGSYVTQTNDSITSLVTKTGIDSLGTGETLRSLIDQTPTQIQLAVSAVRYDNSNLVLNSAASRVVPISNNNNNIADIPFNAGDVVSFGCDVSFEDSDTINQVLLIQEMNLSNVRVYTEWSNENTEPTGSGVFKRLSGTHIMLNNGYFRLGLRSNGTTSSTTFKNIKIENSSSPTKYSPASDDTQSGILAAQNAATNAATAATNAQTAANTANSLLADIANDNKFDPAEKQNTKKEWDAIVSEYSKNITQANSFSVSTTAYTTAYNALSSYITPLLSNLNTTSDIVGTTFRSTFKAYYDSRTDLLNAISTKAKTIADTAQGTANTAINDAAAAQTAADNAATSASAANTAIANIASDNILSASEKSGERSRWNDISAEKAGLNDQATTYSITTENTAYNSAFQNLATYLNNGTTWSSGIPSWLSDANIGTDTTIVGTTYRANWNNYYNARQTLLNAISAKAKAIADSKTTLDEVKSGITINADGITAFGDQFKVDSLLIANAIQTQALNVGSGNFLVGTDGKMSAKGASIEGVVTSIDANGNKIVINAANRSIRLYTSENDVMGVISYNTDSRPSDSWTMWQSNMSLRMYEREGNVKWLSTELALTPSGVRRIIYNRNGTIADSVAWPS